jgi:hypothetical protein
MPASESLVALMRTMQRMLLLLFFFQFGAEQGVVFDGLFQDSLPLTSNEVG